MCINKRFWKCLARMLKWFLNETDGRGRLGRSGSESVLAHLGEMPGALRESLVLGCEWRCEDLRQLARWLSYSTLMRTMKRMCEEEDPGDILSKWRLWQTSLDESNVCAVHWMCA